MGSFLSWLLTLQILTPVLKPGVRLIVGLVAIPLFRLFVRRVVSDEKLDAAASAHPPAPLSAPLRPPPRQSKRAEGPHVAQR